MRARTLALLVALLALAGCLQTGEPADRPVPPNAIPSTDSARNASAGEPTANSSSTPESNDTEPASATDERSTNEAAAVETDEPAELPGNLTMDGADVVERSDDRVQFRWKGMLDPSDGDAPTLATRTLFDVPGSIPLRINPTLDWHGPHDLDLFVDARDVRSHCETSGTLDPGQDGGPISCEVRTMARSSWDRWGVTVRETKLGEDVPTRPTNFTAKVTVEVADPWTGPPVEAPGPADGAQTDPGWPSMDEAEIRPGIKVGKAGAGLNAGTGNFVFSSPDNRTLYLGWVARGVDGLEPGDEVPLPNAGVTARLVHCSWGAIEETVTCPMVDYSQERTQNATTHPRFVNDFALLRLPAEVRSTVHPAVPVHGGPTGIANPPKQNTELVAFGNTPFRHTGRQHVNPLDAMHGIA